MCFSLKSSVEFMFWWSGEGKGGQKYEEGKKNNLEE